MQILFYHPDFDSASWVHSLEQAMPGATVRVWQPGDNAPADFALVWHPPREMLAGRHNLKAVIALGAGVDSVLNQLKQDPDLIPAHVPLYRLEDAGMGKQMQEFAVSQVLRWFRRFDDYQELQQEGRWEPLDEYQPGDFTVGILGAGVLSKCVAESLLPWGFPVRTWSRQPKDWPGVSSFAGNESLNAFLAETRVLINLLPHTPQTEGMINQALLACLPQGAFLLNLGRGAHVVEGDLIAAVESGQILRATLDVVREEPLPANNPLWRHPRVTITPHIAASTRLDDAIIYLAKLMNALEQGTTPAGQVDKERGY